MPKKLNPKRVKIVERKLGREDADGTADNLHKVIEVDPRVNEMRRLNVIVHEAIHLSDWSLPEAKVKEMADFISPIVWKAGYRRVVE